MGIIDQFGNVKISPRTNPATINITKPILLCGLHEIVYPGMRNFGVGYLPVFMKHKIRYESTHRGATQNMTTCRFEVIPIGLGDMVFMGTPSLKDLPRVALVRARDRNKIMVSSMA